jgi:hypothetical protein
MIIPRRILLGMRNISGKNLYRKSKHAFYFQQLLSENNDVYEITWKNVALPEGPHDNTMLRRKVALCMMDN